MTRIGPYLKRADYAFGSFLFTRFFTHFDLSSILLFYNILQYLYYSDNI